VSAFDLSSLTASSANGRRPASDSTAQGATLLTRLGSGVLPPGIDHASTNPAEATSFASLLNRARKGGVSSGREVSLANSLRDNPNVKLSAEDIGKLSAAADILEAAGSIRAMVVLNGTPYELDVGGRTITSILDTNNSQIISGIDAFIDLDNAGFGASSNTASITSTPNGAAAPPSTYLKATATTQPPGTQSLVSLPATFAIRNSNDLLRTLGAATVNLTPTTSLADAHQIALDELLNQSSHNQSSHNQSALNQPNNDPSSLLHPDSAARRAS